MPFLKRAEGPVGAAPAIFDCWLTRDWRLLVVGLAAAGGLLGYAAHWGATRHPDFSPPKGAEAQARIVEVFGSPRDANPVLVGDYLIERFYAFEPETGKRYVADLCKGRVKDIVEATQADGSAKYTVLLDRRGLQSSTVRPIVEKIAPPDSSASYLGVPIQGGMTEAFPLNYDGRLPQERAPFQGPKGQDIFTSISGLKLNDVAWPRVFSNKQNNYLLSSTQFFPYFATLFPVKNAVFLSELKFIDASEGQVGPVAP